MEGHKVCIFIAAIIAISLHSTLAANMNCTTTGSNNLTCPDGVTMCFIKTETNGNVVRGCVTDDTCKSPNCITCNTDNCNVNLMCKSCDVTQASCATTNATEDAYNSLCSANQVCRINLLDNGTLSRGCGEACADGVANCKSCNTDNCNVGIYPADRRLCYQCQGAACNNVNETMLNPCALYQANEQKCYTIGADNNTMQRGCTTDVDTKCSLTANDTNCAFCDDQNGCNNRTFQSVLGSCIKCNNADTCIPSQQADKATECAASNYTQTTNSCYYQLNANGTVDRGCTNELSGGECLESQNCIQCNGSACNIEQGSFSCLTCRSDNYAPCRQAAVGGSSCQNTSLTGNSSMQCYSGEWDGVVFRGCLIDLGQLMKFQCENDEDNRCTICKTANCNNNTFNGAATLQHLGFGLLGLIYLVRQAL